MRHRDEIAHTLIDDPAAYWVRVGREIEWKPTTVILEVVSADEPRS